MSIAPRYVRVPDDAWDHSDPDEPRFSAAPNACVVYHPDAVGHSVQVERHDDGKRWRAVCASAPADPASVPDGEDDFCPMAMDFSVELDAGKESAEEQAMRAAIGHVRTMRDEWRSEVKAEPHPPADPTEPRFSHGPPAQEEERRAAWEPRGGRLTFYCPPFITVANRHAGGPEHLLVQLTADAPTDGRPAMVRGDVVGVLYGEGAATALRWAIEEGA